MTSASTPTARNIRQYPWFRAANGLVFWQAIWFLYIQQELSAAEAIAFYAIYDITTTLFEVPSGYMSDRVGRRKTLIASAVAGIIAASLQAWGGAFWVFALGNICLGISAAFLSGTDTALLYESLAAEDRKDEVERHELVAWRFSFGAFALSAVLGGLLWRIDPSVPYIATALAFCLSLSLAWRFAEPPHAPTSQTPQGNEALRFATLRTAFQQPVLRWLLALSMLMYMFSHIPFVFGQPFILAALQGIGWQAEAPLVSGAVTSIMMLTSVAVSLVAPGIKRHMGLSAILLLAFAMQIGIIGGLALSNSTLVIGLLFLRMVPNSLSGPFILARIQPLLADDSRATFLSIQSLGGRILFAATLFVSAGAASNVGNMPYGDIQTILGWYTAAGLVCIIALALTARRSGVAATYTSTEQSQEPPR